MTNQGYSDYVSSKIGFWTIRADEKKLISISFSRLKPPLATHQNDITELAKTQLTEYFKKERLFFDLPLELDTYSEFYQNVWRSLVEIPYGKTTNYSALANKLNNPKAVRAVGTANGRNPFAIVVPCHRVIGKNNSMTGYAHGVDVKEWLLVHEGAMVKPLTLF